MNNAGYKVYRPYRYLFEGKFRQKHSKKNTVQVI